MMVMRNWRSSGTAWEWDLGCVPATQMPGMMAEAASGPVVNFSMVHLDTPTL